MNLLIVEDKVAETLGKVLRQSGYTVHLAASGEEALEVMERVRIDFFLVDWMLPGMSGLDLVWRLRQDGRYREAPVVMISGRSGKKDIAAAVRTGIDSYLAKPFSPAQLKAKIEAVLARRRAATGGDAVQRIIQGHQAFNPRASDPLVLLAFGARTEEAMATAAPDELAVLEAAVEAVADLNGENPWLNLGYLLAESTGELAQHLKKWSIRDRLALVVLWTRCKGNIALLGRLLAVQQIDDVPLYMLCAEIDGLPEELVLACEEGQMTLLESGDMGREGWKRLIGKRVAADPRAD